MDNPETPSSGSEAMANGLAFARQRNFNEAIARFKIAMADPELQDAARYLAQALTDAGHTSEAEEAWIEHTRRNPQSADAFRHLGNLQKRLDKLAPAIESLGKAHELEPLSATIAVDLGIVLAQARQCAKAKDSFDKALSIQPDFYDAHINLGMLHQEMKHGEEALRSLRRAIEINPDDPSGLNNLGVALAEQGSFDESIACYHRLLERSPGYVLAWNNLGNALRSKRRFAEAVTAMLKALELKPDYTEAHNNLGIIYTQTEHFGDAIRSFDRALFLKPEYPEAHANRGLVYLLMGDFQRGWADYEWRWQGKSGLKRREYNSKSWDGNLLAGKRILLYYEQGLGDTFQFIRYAAELAKRGATVVFECQSSTRNLLGRTQGISEFFIRGDKPPRCDFHAPLLSLPGLCQTNLDSLPRRIPYIFPDPLLAWEWKQRLGAMPDFKVGIVWQGNPEHKGDANRSITLTTFAPLTAVPGVTLISLQKNFGVEQLAALNRAFPLTDLAGVAEDADGFERTAAIIAGLDLVICADTSIAHLAGAMGVPVWVALPTSPDWRWLLEREDTPWYPTMRLFRQKHAGDWAEVFDRIAIALSERVNRDKRHSTPTSPPLLPQDNASLMKAAVKHLQQNKLAEAQTLLEQILKNEPTHAPALQDLGVAYAKQNRLADALVCFRRALELAPESPDLYGNLGLACLNMGHVDEAVSHLRTAVLLGAGSAETHKTLAKALLRAGDAASSEQSYWAALRLVPDDVDAHLGLSRALLTQGKLEQGWLEQEWRWRRPGATHRQSRWPRWTGQPLNGKSILIFAEDDSRDLIQFARYADVLARQGARVTLECDAPFVPLLSGCLGLYVVVTVGNPIPPQDFYVHLLSLPAACNTTLDTLPVARPYLGIDGGIAAIWQKRFPPGNTFRIGLGLDATSNDLPDMPSWAAWCERHALMDPSSGRRRTQFIDVTQNVLTPAASPSIKGLNEFGLTETNPGQRLIHVAAAIRAMDLFITTDTPLAHIAAAMGVATWIVLPPAPHPRWMLGRSDSLWYPTARLFRMHSKGDFDITLTRMGRLLESPGMP